MSCSYLAFVFLLSHNFFGIKLDNNLLRLVIKILFDVNFPVINVINNVLQHFSEHLEFILMRMFGS